MQPARPLASRLVAGAQIAGLAVVWSVALVPAALFAGGAALVGALRRPKVAGADGPFGGVPPTPRKTT